MAALAASPALAQSSYHINTAEKLNTLILTSIFKDRNNNMWVGSYNGLFKHEGSNIRAFKRTGRPGKTISGNELHTIIEDRLGFIWIGTANGLDKIDPVTYQVKHYPLRSADSSSSYVGYIYSVFQDKEDFIWASTDAAMFRMNYKTGKYVTIPQTNDKTGMPSYSASYKSGISTDKGIWIHTAQGMVYYEYATASFFHRYHNPRKEPIFNLTEQGRGNQSDLRVDKKNNLWFVSNEHLLVRYNLETSALDSFPFVRPPMAWKCCYSVAIDHKENVWIGFRHGGLLIFDQQTHQFRSVMAGFNGLIKSNYLHGLEEDYRGQMWVSTDNGLDIVNLYDSSVNKIHLSNREDFVNLKYEMATPTTDGHSFVYIPFYRYGFLQVNMRSDSIRTFHLGASQSGGSTYIIPRDENKVWAARGKKLIGYDLRKNESDTLAKTAPVPDSVRKYPGDIIWHYSTDTLTLFKKNSGMIYLLRRGYPAEMLEGAGFKKNLALSPDKKIFWYINSQLNLVRRDLVTHAVSAIDLQQKLRPLDFSFSNPRDMADDGSNIWITSQNGLLRYIPATGKLLTYSEENGLAHGFTFALCLDRDNRLWVASLGGIDRFDAAHDVFQNIVSHPTDSYMDAFGGGVLSDDGKLYFASGNKLFILNPEALQQPDTSAHYNLLLQEVLVNGEAYNWRRADNQQLDYKHNSLLFRFGLLDFTTQKNIKYFYYLEGLEDDWMENLIPGEVSYNSLPPGNYTFHLRSSDAAGTILAEEFAFPFRIRPPFWQTWWFKVLVISLIGFIIIYFFRRRIHRIKNQAAIKQQMAELEARALRAQMNPHFIFNSLNAIQELIVTKNFDEAYQYLSHFSKLLRMVLNNSEKNFIPLADELEMNRLYLELESLRFKQSFHYEITVNPEIEEETMLVPSLLLQPFLENAIWHGLLHKEGLKKLVITFSSAGDDVLCTIADNGIGRERSAAIKAGKIGASHFESKGMNLSRQRIETLNRQLSQNLSIDIEDITDTTGKPAGTRVLIRIPKRTTFIK